MEDRIGRVKEMEARLNRLLAWLDHQEGDIGEDVRALEGYFRTAWREDFEADEAGEIPAGIPRGVLSEDGLYDALTAYEEIRAEGRERPENRIQA